LYKKFSYLLIVFGMQPVRSAYQPPASSTFLSERTSHQLAVLFSQNKPAPAISHQPTEQADGLFYLAIFFLKSYLNLLAQSFGGAHKGRICVRVFIGVRVPVL
jgi:hypothetical protein